MGLYNVVAPCVVEQWHYTRPTTQPIEVDDDMAAPLIQAGQLESVEAEHHPHAHRSRRRTAED